MDLSEMRSELVRLGGRVSDLAVEHVITQRMRDRVVVDLYRAGVDPAEIADLAGLLPVDIHHLAQEGATRSLNGPDSEKQGTGQHLRETRGGSR